MGIRGPKTGRGALIISAVLFALIVPAMIFVDHMENSDATSFPPASHHMTSASETELKLRRPEPFTVASNPAQRASVATEKLGPVDLAHSLCSIMDSTKMLTEKCSVSVWKSTVDARVNMTIAESQKLCATMAGMLVKAGSSIGNGWQLRIFSPYSGDHPVASCDI